MEAPGTSSVEISLIQGPDVQPVWRHVRDLLARVIEMSQGELTEFSIYEAINCCNAQLWVAMLDGRILCALVTEILLYPSGTRVCNLYAVSGDQLPVWKDMILARVEAFAIDEGCARVVITGRSGWERVLRADGYELTSVYLTKTLGASHG